MAENSTASRDRGTGTGSGMITWLRGRGVVHLLGMLITLLVIAMQVLPPASLRALLTRIDHLVYDLRFNLMPAFSRDFSHNIVVVDIDERSLQAEGHWPWDRFKLASLLERLDEYGVLVTGFDITFPEPQRNLVEEILGRAGEEIQGEVTGALESMRANLDADLHFARTIETSAMDVVLALSFNPVEPVAYGSLPPSLISIDEQQRNRLRLQKMAGYTGNIPVLQAAADGAGIMNQLPDVDGVVRRVPLVVRYGDSLFPTLALEMVRLYFFEDNFQLVTYDDGESLTIDGVRIGSNAGQYEIATDALSQVMVPYTGPSVLGGGTDYRYVSATDVLNGNVEASVLENALVLIGTTSTGLFDLRATPVESVYPGVEVHANILNALLQSFEVQEIGSNSEETAAETATTRYFPYKPVWEQGALLVLLAGLGLLLSLGLPALGPASLAAATLALMAAAVWLNFWLWQVHRMDLTLTLPLLLILLLGILNMAWGFLAERLSRKTIKDMFDQYVPPAHIDAMLKDPEAYSFEGESREMTVLFSDIRSFTSISESLSATGLKTLLNDFFTPVTGIIFDHNGTIDKYVGDMVMAFWGAPIRDEKHRDHAVLAALEMLEKTDELHAEFARRGYPEVNIGIGINTGIMNVGDMGSRYRRSYTVLGDSVNLGSRLEALTKFYHVRCLIGEGTFNGLEGVLCRLVDKVRVKGKHHPVRIYEPVCALQDARPDQLEMVQRWDSFMAAYFNRDWELAGRLLDEIQGRGEYLELLAEFRQRIENLRQMPAEEAWDGGYQHETK